MNGTKQDMNCTEAFKLMFASEGNGNEPLGTHLSLLANETSIDLSKFFAKLDDCAAVEARLISYMALQCSDGFGGRVCASCGKVREGVGRPGGGG